MTEYKTVIKKAETEREEGLMTENHDSMSVVSFVFSITPLEASDNSVQSFSSQMKHWHLFD